MSCGVGCRCGLDPPLLWLWCRLVATAPIQPLAWEPPYVMGVALEKTKKKKARREKQQIIYNGTPIRIIAYSSAKTLQARRSGKIYLR